jgi:hypothetical protein
MFRGYRCLIIALGLILIGAAPQNGSKERRENTKAQTDASKSAPSVSLQPPNAIQVSQPPIHDRPCNQGSDNRQSDLCAQWKAADAASKAAWWAAVATFVTALGTFGLFWQIKLTREAVQDTGNATEAMVRANQISQLGERALIEVLVKITDRHLVGHHAEIIVHNIGRSVALNVVGCNWYSNDIPRSPNMEIGKSHRYTLMPDTHQTMIIIVPEPPESNGYYIFGSTSYTCVYGDAHVSRYCFRIDATEYNPLVKGRASRVAIPCTPADWPTDT